MRKINDVAIVLKGVLPCEGVVISTLVLTFHAVLVIADIGSSSGPSSPVFSCCCLRVN